MTLISDYDLSHNNTMALCSTARFAVLLDDGDTFLDKVKFALEFAKKQSLPLFVLSFGSNVILPSTLNAVVLLPRMQGIEILKENDDSVTLKVACGENWHDFVKFCLTKGWYGLENLALIPGLVGASPVQNIGAYGVQVSDFIKKVIAIDLNDGTEVVFDNFACHFDYRHSIFKEEPNHYLIGYVVFELHKNVHKINANYGDVATVAQAFATKNNRPSPTPHDVFDAVVQIRQEKLPDPAVLANCGSFFQNPIIPIGQFNELKQRFADLPSYLIDDKVIKVPAGWLIDKAELKGKGVFPILTHEKQALVLTNHAPHTASQNDIKTAQDFIIKAVQDKFGIVLVREPVWVA